MSVEHGLVDGESTLASPWLTVEVDPAALAHNVAVFRALLDPTANLMAVVKANAYGHGLLLAARAFLDGGADLLGVHSLAEAHALRLGGMADRIIVLGPLTAEEARACCQLDAEITLGSVPALEALERIQPELPHPLKVHLKVETGVNRQGLVENEFAGVLHRLSRLSGIIPQGLSSHFADIEDTTDHAFARGQMERFESYLGQWRAAGLAEPETHMSCSAAALLFENTHRSIARVGVSAYGIWPSRETRVSVRQAGRPEVVLKPALTWKCRISQVRQVPAGQSVGYGRAWRAMTDSRVAVLPVGYSDGWPRALAGRAHVLVAGKRAPIVGRICMNLCMVDVTHIPEAQAGDQAVLLGRQGDDEISAEMLADQLGTIAYEVLTLPGPTWNWVAV